MRLAANCERGKIFDFQHGLSCKKDVFILLRDDLVRKITYSLLNELYKDT